jgi:Helix-turn-helix domain
VSTEYYTRLEQGRAGNPSPEVVDALAGWSLPQPDVVPHSR